MEVNEFFAEAKRMCLSNTSCSTCPLTRSKICDFMLYYYSTANYFIDIVIKWSKEHPKATRQSKFLEQFPNTKLNEDGVICFCPKLLDTSLYISSTDYYPCSKKENNCGITCCDCLKEYWLTEISEEN